MALLAGVLVIASAGQVAHLSPAFAQDTFQLDAHESDVVSVSLPPTAAGAQASAIQSGHREWKAFLTNSSPAPATNATISVNSGYAPSQFTQPLITAFPVTGTVPSLASGQTADGPGQLTSTIPVSFSLGYNSTRQASPSVIPVGGTRQTLTVTVTPIDPRYQSGGTPDSPFGIFNIIVDSQVPGVSVVSTTGPDNLNQGEQLQPATSPPGSLLAWQLGLTQTNKTYTFTAVLNVPNATGAPFAYSPEVSIDGEGTAFLCQACLGSAVTITDATLDGNVPGSGSATFSVAETGLTWRVAHSDSFDVDYQGTTPAPDAALGVTRIAAVVDGGRHAAVGVTFTDDDPAGSLSQYSGTVAWGDGSTTTIPKYLFTKIPARLGGGFAAGSLHTYARTGSHVVTVTINDVGGASASKSATLDMPSR
jgi:hypothetical protein